MSDEDVTTTTTADEPQVDDEEVDESQVDDEEISADELDEVSDQVVENDSDASDEEPDEDPDEEPGRSVDDTADGGDDEQEDGDDEVDQLPGHVGTVVVPLANPRTAADLIAIAIALAFCEHGGEVIGVAVTTDDAAAEAAAEMTEELREILEEADHDHPEHDVELVTRSATSVARGIVELAREENAGLIVLGIPAPGEEASRSAGPRHPSETGVGGAHRRAGVRGRHHRRRTPRRATK